VLDWGHASLPRGPPAGGSRVRPAGAAGATTGSTGTLDADADGRTSSDHLLLEALDQPGCPLCRLAAQTVQRSLEALAYEQVTDVETQLAFRAALGLCALHAGQWLEQGGSGQGLAILYRAALADAEGRLGREAGAGSGWLGLGRRGAGAETRLRPGDPCLACRARDDATSRNSRALLERLSQPEVAAAYADSVGLCLAHLNLALRLAGTRRRAAAHALIEQQRRRLAALDTELAEFVRKHDYRFQREPFGPERDAPQRVVAAFVGERGVW